MINATTNTLNVGSTVDFTIIATGNLSWTKQAIKWALSDDYRYYVKKGE